MVHVPFDTTSISFNQYGYGDYAYFKGLQPYQRGFGYNQRGAGLGDILRSLWRTIFPVLKSAGTTLGKEALTTGSRILEKVTEGENLQQAAINEGKRGVDNLIERGVQKLSENPRQFGTGLRIGRKKYKRNKNNSISHLVGKRVKLFKKLKRSDAFGFY